MAGPNKVGQMNVTDVGAPIRDAATAVGSIYEGYRKGVIETERHNELMKKLVDEENKQGRLKAYDPRLGVGNRGLSAEAAEEYDRQESALLEKYTNDQMNGKDVPAPDELFRELQERKKGLITQENAQNVISEDLFKLGLTPEEVNAYAAARTKGLTSRADLIASEKAQADASNASNADIRKAETDILAAQINAVKANNTGYGRSSSRSYSSGYDKNGVYSSRGTKDGSIIDVQNDLKEVLPSLIDAEIFGFSPSRDSDKTILLATQGFDKYNEILESQGLPPLTTEDLTRFTVSNIKRGFDNKFAYDTPGDVVAALTKRYPIVADSNGSVRVGNSSRGYSSGGQRSRISALPQESIDKIRNVVNVAPRSMADVERLRVARMFSRYNMPKPESTSSTGSNATTSGQATTTTPKGGAGSNNSNGNSKAPSLKDAQAAVNKMLKEYEGKDVDDDADVKSSTEDNPKDDVEADKKDEDYGPGFEKLFEERAKVKKRISEIDEERGYDGDAFLRRSLFGSLFGFDVMPLQRGTEEEKAANVLALERQELRKRLEAIEVRGSTLQAKRNIIPRAEPLPSTGNLARDVRRDRNNALRLNRIEVQRLEDIVANPATSARDRWAANLEIQRRAEEYNTSFF